MPPDSYHTIEANEVCNSFTTDPDRGIKASDVGQRRSKYGENKLPDPEKVSYLRIFLKQLIDFMVLLLIAAAGLSAAFGDFKAMVVLLVVVVVNIAIGFSQEAKAERALSSLLSSRQAAQQASVVRDGHVSSISASDLVVGDIVQLEEGDQVPADLRLIHTSHLQIDESTLTGESVPVDKVSKVLKKPNLPLGDRKNMAYMMTMVARGRGNGVVIAVGITTEVGKTSKAMQKRSKRRKTNLQQKLSQLGKWLVLVSVVLCALVTVIGVLRGVPLFKMVETGVSLAVSVIPEGLVAVTTVTMALGVQRMAKHKAIVRQLPAVEVLGAVSVIASDKTGTLTEGKMVADQVWLIDKTYYVSGSGFIPEGNFYEDKELNHKLDKIPPALEHVLLVCSLCNNSSVYSEEDDIEETEDAKGKSALKRENFRRDSQGNIVIPKVDDQGHEGSPVVKARKPSLAHTPRRLSAAPSDSLRRQSISQNLGRRASQLGRRASIMGRRASQVFSRKDYGTFADQDKKKNWKTVGTPTEIALNVLGMKAGFFKDQEEDSGWEFIRDIPFDSDRKRMSVVYNTPDGKGCVVFTKGAWEHLLPLCTHYKNERKEDIPLNNAAIEKINEKAAYMAVTGNRVLAVATRSFVDDPGTFADDNNSDIDGDEADSSIERSLVFLGLIGLIDPPRTQVVPAVQACHQAGVTVIMITGDHPTTAKCIAKKLDLLPPDANEDKYIMSGHHVEAMSDEELKHLNPFPRVFARVSPEVKLRVVKALQNQGKIVAFVGDGVNDAAAIKHAHVGVAMGTTGTDVSQQCADVILSDDNFEHIVIALEEGRRIYDNIFKFTIYLLSCNSAEIFIMLINIALNEPMPFTAIQILFANIIADVPPSLSLGVEPVEKDVMYRAPRNPKKHFFGLLPAVVVILQGLVMSSICTAAFISAIKNEDYDLLHAQCLVFSMLVLIQLVHAFLSRSFTKSVFTTGILGNWWLLGAFAFSAGCLVAASYIPGFNSALDMMPLTPLDWAKIGIAIVIHGFIVEIIKVFLRIAEKQKKKRKDKKKKHKGEHYHRVARQPEEIV